MARDPRHDLLFQPIRIGPKTLRNRFYQVPHCTAFGTGKPGTQAAHRGMKAEGGWAAVCTEFCSIGPESDAMPHVSAHLWDDDDVHNLSAMVDAVHEHGALAGVELWHGGSHAPGADSRMLPRAPSQVPGDTAYSGGFVTPRPMDKRDIREVQQLYVDAAQRARRAGFDIVYVYGGHSYLLMQFLSPWYNKRTDEYGGSLENRARFWRETLERVREEVGDTCAIAARISFSTQGPGGASTDDVLGFVELADHLVDVWDVTIATMKELDRDSAPSRFYGENSQRELQCKVRARTAKPVIGVGRFVDPDVMVRAIATGQVDIIGAARPSIADPFLPQKIDQGRLDEVRECTGANICLARVWTHHLACMQNPTAGEEYRRGWHPERFTRAANADRDVLIVGAGAAGMECAVVLGKRKMRRVHLVEAEPAIGGYAALVARLPHLGEWARVANYRKIQLDKLKNVEVITRARLTADAVREYGADIVVVATGAQWVRDGTSNVTGEPIPGIADQHVFTPEDLLAGDRAPEGETVIVYDCEAYFMGPGLAELLRALGKRVTLVTPLPVVSPYLDSTLEGPGVRRSLHDLGVEVRTQTSIAGLERGSALLRHEYGREERVAADAVVPVTARVSRLGLYQELMDDPEALEREGIEAVYAIGDCVAPRLIGEAVFDGHRLGREIDSPDPSVPLPYIRERQILGATVPAAAAAVAR